MHIAHAIRNKLAGKDSSFTFTPMDDAPLMAPDHAHLHVHVPFCKNHCPYCPYFKLPYDRDRVEHYAHLLLREIDIVADRYGHLRAPSVYFGGGTPALLGEDLARVTNRLAKRFDVDAIAMELRPENCDREGIALLADSGVTQVSVGVQSFQPELLKTLGKCVSVPVMEDGLERLAGAGLRGVNADMMFVLPGQSMEQLKEDMKKIVLTGVDQVTCYPLFTFPYTSAGRHLAKQRLRMPSLFARHAQYRFLWEFFADQGYHPASVWSVIKPGALRFSSVTRDQYIGLGAGAASHLPGHFWFNPFDLALYRDRNHPGKDGRTHAHGCRAKTFRPVLALLAAIRNKSPGPRTARTSPRPNGHHAADDEVDHFPWHGIPRRRSYPAESKGRVLGSPGPKPFLAGEHRHVLEAVAGHPPGARNQNISTGRWPAQ